jgi:hypothetical protein
MASVESLNFLGNALLVALQVGIAGYGVMLAIGRFRLTSPFTLEPVAVRRSRITGVILVIGQLAAVTVVATITQPSSAIALAPAVAASLLGWIVEGLLPGGEYGGAKSS